MVDFHVKSDSKEWEKIKEKIFTKVLFRDDSKDLELHITKVEPYGESPLHKHKCDEWVYILEGSMSDETGTFYKGDFILNKKDSEHKVKTCADGCLLLVLTSEFPY